jgi:hypothetical protein
MPNTALKASACAPVPAVAAAAAVFAVAHVARAVASAPQVFTKVSQINSEGRQPQVTVNLARLTTLTSDNSMVLSRVMGIRDWNKNWNGCVRRQRSIDAPRSTGRKLVSFLLSNPTPNSISGMEHLPKSPMLPLAGGTTAVGAGAAVAVEISPKVIVTASLPVAAGFVPDTVTVMAV